MTIEPSWELVEPGLLRLATTNIYIRYQVQGASAYFVIQRDTINHGSFPNLDQAKAHALKVARDLLNMGIEP